MSPRCLSVVGSLCFGMILFSASCGVAGQPRSLRVSHEPPKSRLQHRDEPGESVVDFISW
jgi:hypothetical protein